MLQIDHVYEFLYQELFKDFEFWHLFNGVPNANLSNISVFTQKHHADAKIFFYDQEPIIPQLADPYINKFQTNPIPSVLVTSEKSLTVDSYVNLKKLYYFFHGFAALDWYRGYYALNYTKSIVKPYTHDFITFNRIINNDRSYRIYFVSQLLAHGLRNKGLISFGVTDDLFDSWQDEVADSKTKLSADARLHAEHHMTDINKLIIDFPQVRGSASADIPRTIDRIDYNNDRLNVDAFWHIVTETVFYYQKLHLTEKVFKPIVSKQPFMLLAAPGNLAYLRSYGFKTFDGIIDESYDLIQDNDQRIEAVVQQLAWYCNLSDGEKTNIMQALEPIVLHNFHHFYGDFKQIIAQELITNTKSLFQELGYDDSHIDYDSIYHTLTH